jgi:hypothetical protein
MSWPYSEDDQRQDHEAWIDLTIVPAGWRRPTELKEMPVEGRVVIGHPSRWQAAAYFAAQNSLDYFLNDLAPSTDVYIFNLDVLL